MPTSIRDYGDLATTADMTFDEVFRDNVSNPTMDGTIARKYNGAQPTPPITPCFSEETHATGTSAEAAYESITGTFNDVELRYRVDHTRVLGTGHLGSVRGCIDRSTGRRRAVKSVRKDDPAAMPGCLAREIALLREMNHRSVLRLVDVFEDVEYVHLVTELYTGGELFDRIVERASSNNGRPCFAEEEAARIIRQVLGAVSYMHDRGIVHRDLKPENILFESRDEGQSSPVVKIVDFGLARKHGGKEPPMTTIVGTPYYIAPEVLCKRYDRSCDLWSVGIVAYILLCGYPPFDGANKAEVYDAVRRGTYRFPSKEWSVASTEARAFVRRLLRTNPRKRMTARRALDHPWIEKNNVVRNYHNATAIDDEGEDRQDTSSVEVAFHRSSRREDEIICRDGPPPMRKRNPSKARKALLHNVRKALFTDV
eukprot:CAMPEP_0181079968 /NCGR_PEP_ID=MMETSP1071-20121207/2313_1 /TAXON_ID=35127 /ORGANISM="Thalassiosira sp., Strain NH16" /LENGTH=425 /DNA_ID=CAMNT_0023161407 /DNA_START=330 /DNA_END=1607 /DNA_ORIENTATION=+